MSDRALSVRQFLSPRALGVMIFIALGIGILFFSPNRDDAWQWVHEQLDVWEKWTNENLLLALLIYFTTYILLVTPPIPMATITALVGGALFGRWLGAGVLSLAGTTSATLAFLASRYLFHDWVQHRFAKPARIINRGIEREGAMFLAMLRVVPVLPFFVINMAMGLTKFPTKQYIVISWITQLPFAFLYANAGTALRQIRKPGDVFTTEIIVALLLLACIPVVIRFGLSWFHRGRANAN